MISSEDAAFLDSWEKKREQEKNNPKPLLAGFSAGIALGIGVVILLESGLLERATMVANSRLSSLILVLAIGAIAAFMGIFYRKFRWEMMEQRYQELKAAQKKAETAAKSSLQP